MFQNTHKRAMRRAYPIHAYVGANGGGKSCAMVWDTLPSLEAGRPVLSTVRLLDYQNPRPCDDPLCDHAEHQLGVEVTHLAAHPAYVALREWGQLMEATKCDVLLDEVTGVASSRESAGLPPAVANKLVQLRRSDVVVRWSAPAWARADKIIRETSQSVTYCVGRMPVTSTDGERQWRNRRLFFWKTYDAAAFEDFTAGKREQLRAEVSDVHWGPKSPAFAAYDTLDAVSTVGTVTETGKCYQCGGRRRVPECRCDGHGPVARARRSDADAGVPSGVAGAAEADTTSALNSTGLRIR